MIQTRRPPRLLVKTLLVTFGTAALLLALVFIVVRQGVQNQVRRTQAQSLDVSQSIMQAMESGRLRELRMQAETLAENLTLKAAVDTYAAESSLTGGSSLRELLATVQRELDKLVKRVDVDAVVLEDFNGRTLAAAGRMQGHWSSARPQSGASHDKAFDEGELLELVWAIGQYIGLGKMIAFMGIERDE